MCIVVRLQIYPVHSGGRFRKYPFIEIVYVVYVWTGGLNAQKIYAYEPKRIRVDGVLVTLESR